MKKGALSIVGAALLLCAGCTQKLAEPTVTPSPMPTLPIGTVTPTLTETPGPVIEKDISSWISPSWTESTWGNLGESCYVYQSDSLSILIRYPELHGEGNDGLNALFRATAVDEWADDDLKGDGLQGSVDGDWAASRSDERLLSIRFREEYCIGMANPSREERTVTIDRESGKRLSLADIVDTGSDFKGWLYAQSWTTDTVWYDDGEEPDIEDYIKEQLGRFLGSTGPADHIEDFYLTDTDLVIIAWYSKYDTHLSVPLSDLKLKGGDLWNG